MPQKDEDTFGQALFERGLRLLRGYLIPKNEAQGAALLCEAAQKGNILAQHLIALLYKEGRGVKKNFVEAARWYNAAADRGLPAALRDLAELYATGRGVEKNNTQSAKLWQKAAERGDAAAQEAIGLAYARGRGVTEEYGRAYAWLSCAERQGQSTAKDHKRILEGLMTPQEIASAQILGIEFINRYALRVRDEDGDKNKN